ncbi:MAG: protein kinase family protein [bacterium]
MVDEKNYDLFINVIEQMYYEQKQGVDNYFYNGFTYDDYMDQTIYDAEFISFEQYVYNFTELEFNDVHGFLEIDTDVKRTKVLECLYNYFDKNFTEHKNESLVNKFRALCKRLNITISNDTYYSTFKSSIEIKEGSICNVEFISDLLVKKQLKLNYTIEDKKRLKYEYEMMEQLKEHINFVDVCNYDEDNNSFIMDRCDSTLYEYLLKNKLETENKIDIITQILNGMQYALDKNIIHRDLHLGNILMMNNIVKICDFGFAKDYKTIKSLVTSSGNKLSHLFVAPETLKNFKNSNHLSDIYSIGKIIDFIMGDTFDQQHLLYSIVKKCMDRESSRRYQSYTEIYNAIEAVINATIETETTKEVLQKLSKGYSDIEQITIVQQAINEKQISELIIDYKINNFKKIFDVLDYQLQLDCLNVINDTFVNATGYNCWDNYNYFVNLSEQIIIDANIEEDIKMIAAMILKECSYVRYNAQDKIKHITLSRNISTIIKNILTN